MHSRTTHLMREAWLFFVWEPSRGKNRSVICLASDKRSSGGFGRGRNPEACWSGKGEERVRSFGGESSRNGHSSDLEDGAAPRRCHVSVRRRDADPPPHNHDRSLALDLPDFTFRHRGWTLLSHRSDHLVECGKCGDGVGQLHGGYSCRILCIVVRTLCRLFSSLQKPGERY